VLRGWRWCEGRWWLTGYLISKGCEPLGRWETQRFDAGRGSIDATRNFKVRTIQNDYARSIET
jgi:hypothetical protein